MNIIKPGDRVYIGSGCSEPVVFTEKLVKEKQWSLSDVQLLHFLKLSKKRLFCEHNPTRFRYNTLSIIGSPEMRKAVNEGKIDFTPINSSEISRLLKGRRHKIDVALIQVTPPDKTGHCSLGINVDINRTVVDVADTVIAQVNPKMPRTMGNSFIRFMDLDYFLHDERLIEIPNLEIDETSEKISEYVARLIENGSTINMGLGKIAYSLPNKLLEADKQDLAFYSEVLPETIINLIDNGNVTCAKNAYPHVMTSFIIGTERFYRYVDNNPFIEFHETEYITNVENIARNKKLCSIYGGLKVDIFGQVTNHEIIDGRPSFYGGIGGEADFMRGSAMSKGGKSIIALPSVDKNGNSNIVASLSGALVTLRAIDVHYIVTEYGIAHLHGKTVRERILEIISIAHPKYRNRLLQAAKQYNYVYEDQIIPLREDGLAYACPDIEWKFETKSKGTVLFRPVRPSDEEMLQDLYYSLSERDRIMRFLSPQKIFPHEETQQRILCDYETSMVIVGLVGKKEEDQRIIAACAYYLDTNTNLAEISATVHEEYRHQGLGTHLIDKLMELTEERGIKGLYGDVNENNAGMLHILNQLPYNIVFKSDPDDPGTLHFYFHFNDN